MRLACTAPKRPSENTEKVRGGEGKRQPGQRGASEREERMCLCM